MTEDDTTAARRYRKATERFAAADHERLMRDVHNLLETESGRRIFILIEKKGGIYDKANLENLPYQAGRRDFALELLALANQANLDGIYKARAEFLAEQNERNELLNSIIANE